MKQNKGRRRTKRKTRTSLDPLLAVLKDLGARVISLLRSARIRPRMKQMQMVERLAISNKHSVVLLRVDNQLLVVGCTGESMVLLGTKKPHEEAAVQIPTKEDLVQAFERVQ